jgi:uncharacterized protein (DUF1778 family)
MAADQVQISATVSEETRALLDEATEARGLKKGHVIEEALLHYLHALRELPSDVIIPSRLRLTETSGRETVDRVLHPREPNDAMKSLMAGEDGDDVPA